MKALLILALAAALSACKSAVPLPPRALDLNSSGVEALARGDLETADSRLSLALEYSPEFVDALVNLGLVELERGNFERARQLIERARRLNPDVAQPHHALGVLAERERRPDRASSHYYEALRVDPGFGPARANLGRLLFAAGKVEEALVQYRRLMNVAPEEPAGYVGLAEALLRAKRVTEADAVVEDAATRFDDVPELELLQARKALRKGAIEEAMALLLPLARDRSDIAVAALGWLAVAELMRDRPRHAVGAAHRALDLAPNDSVATYAMAVALSRLDSPEARPWALRAARVSPGDALLSEELRAK